MPWSVCPTKTITTGMANKGKFGDDILISEETWTDFHSKPILRTWADGAFRAYFTKGGV